MQRQFLLSLTFLLFIILNFSQPVRADVNMDIQKGIDLFHQGKVDEAINLLDSLIQAGNLDKYEQERVQSKLTKYREYSRLQKEYLELAKNKKYVPTERTVPTYGSSELADTYVVRPGDSLWLIASYGFVYSDITKGNLIYEANRDQIEDPNKIYPGQVLHIKR